MPYCRNRYSRCLMVFLLCEYLEISVNMLGFVTTEGVKIKTFVSNQKPLGFSVLTCLCCHVVNSGSQ